MPYGKELILDMHECKPETFNRKSLDQFFTELCELIDMEKCDVHFWDDVDVPPEEQQTDPKTKGTSAVCFILTSSIVVHTLDELKSAYVNIFSCKDFNVETVHSFCLEHFRGKVVNREIISRQ